MKKFLIFFSLLLILPFQSKAQVAFFKTHSSQYYFGDLFLVRLKVHTGREKINAGQIEIEFPKEKLKLVEIFKEKSIFSLWPEEPSLSVRENGKISFVGGVPLGFQGEGNILTLAFEVISKEKGPIWIRFSPSSFLLLNDGFGTKGNFEFEDLEIFLLGENFNKKKNEIQDFLRLDSSLPSFFEVLLGRHPLVFEGKYFLSFVAVDSESGIDHYEVREGNQQFRKVFQNFYLIEDQSLKSTIQIKAKDKAGKEKIFTLWFGNENHSSF